MDTKTINISLCCFYILVFGFVPSIALRSYDFPAIFVFGDSNADTGSMQAAFPLFVTPPYGDTFFRKPAGRFSDGRLIVDFIAERLSIPHVSAYINSMGTSFTNGANFASGRATIGLETSTMPSGLASPFNLQAQFLQFLHFKSKSQIIRKQGDRFAKSMPKEDYFAKGLYIFDIGQNDIALISKPLLNASIPLLINQYSATIEEIYKAGGRTFWIHNLGPVGCLPLILVNFPDKDEAGCSKIYTQLAQYFNSKLNQSIFQLRTKYPLATFVYVDIYSIKYSLFSSPKQHGFELPHVACCGRGGMYNFNITTICGQKVIVNGEEITINSCEDPSKRVVWDGIHYTEAANKFVFNQIMSGAFSHPPIPLNKSYGMP